MKLDIRFIFYLIGANVLMFAVVLSSNPVLTMLILIGLTTALMFYNRNRRLQQQLNDAEFDRKIDELILAENATRKRLSESLIAIRSQGTKLKKNAETIARLQSEMVRVRGGQQRQSMKPTTIPTTATIIANPTETDHEHIV
jgi:hypothetical protein